MARRKTAEERFWARANRTPGDGCWLWTGGRNHDGYGKFWYKGKNWIAHRFSWLLHFGSIPSGMDVLHRCDTPACTNPAHLFLGTRVDNVIDRDRKGRAASGDRHGAHTHPERFPGRASSNQPLIY